MMLTASDLFRYRSRRCPAPRYVMSVGRRSCYPTSILIHVLLSALKTDAKCASTLIFIKGDMTDPTIKPERWNTGSIDLYIYLCILTRCFVLWDCHNRRCPLFSQLLPDISPIGSRSQMRSTRFSKSFSEARQCQFVGSCNALFRIATSALLTFISDSRVRP
jgi:hypothetical protein